MGCAVTVVALPLAPIALVLSFPPSANALNRAVNGRVMLSKRYRFWKKTVATEIMIQRPRKLKGRYSLVILADRPDRRRRDVDNLAKAISDALKAAEVIADDHLADEVTTRWSNREPGKGARVWITLEGAA